ncbi:MAG TPA: sigma-70 family RNA polymerase sigma factor [Candidatus Paceibacterota bacterium]|jgi:RNA polymerase sigma factor (sigma-70 family)
MKEAYLDTRIPTPEDRQRENMESLLAALGRDGTEEDRAEIETHIAALREEISKTPKVGRMLEVGVAARNELVIALTSKEQQERILETLSELGIFPWEEQGLLIIDRKSDLKKLELAGISKHAVFKPEEPPKPDTAVGPDIEAQRYAFPLPQQAPVERRREARPPKVQELFEAQEQEPGVDTELLDIVRKFDAGILDEDDPEFVQAYGNMPTLTLFPHKYVWDKKAKAHLHVITGEAVGPEGEAELLEKAIQGDARAADAFTRMHVGFVVFFAKRVHEKFGGDIDEIFQDGLHGLTYAMQHYDPEEAEDSKFTSYAAKCVEGYMRSGLAANRTPVRVPANNKKAEVRGLRNKEEKKKQLEGPEYGLDEDEALRILAIEKLEKRLLIGAQFDPIESHFNDEAWQQQDYSGNSLAQMPEQPSYVDAEKLKQRINKSLLSLSPREEMVIRLRFGLGETVHTGEATVSRTDSEGLTASAVGEIMGITGGRVIQIEAKALRKMMHPSRAIKMTGFYQGTRRIVSASPEDQPFEVKRTVEEGEQKKKSFAGELTGKFGFRKTWSSVSSLAEEFSSPAYSISQSAEKYKDEHPEWFNENGELHEDLVEILKREARESRYGHRGW